MKKYALLLLLSMLWLGATYTSRGTDQSWRFDRSEVLEELDALSGKWENVTPKN